MSYLWDFSFEELFLAENGKNLLKELTHREQQLIGELCQIFKETAEQSRRRIQRINAASFKATIPELIRNDRILHLCLIYSLAVQELPYIRQEMRLLIEKEIDIYFKEMYCCRNVYGFEKYSFMNQLAESSATLF
ncbi:hypothetical protein ACYSNR_18010 [Enterococcus sp. LJL128]|uniref:hypothetical protein n=1 Tax=Enterococcus sp. LJL51 TaxID=3416656 RepID=UPI003CEA4D2A